MPIPAAFYTISSFPYSQLVTVADFNAGTHGDAANEVWFKYVLTTGQGLGALTDMGAGTGSPVSKIFIYESDALTLRTTISSGAGGFIEAVTVTNYWIKVIKDGGGGAIAADFTFYSDSLPFNPTPTPGDYIINDDSNPFGGIIMGVDGTPRGIATDVPAGEMVATLPSGHVLVHDRFLSNGPGKYLVLTDPNLVLISAFDLSPSLTGAHPAMGTSLDHFYVGNQVNRNVYKIDIAGTATLVATAVSGALTLLSAVGVNVANTILYYVVSGTNEIRRWNLSTDTAMSVFYTIAEISGSPQFALLARTSINSHPGEVIVLSDGSVVTHVIYQSGGDSIDKIYHIDSAGTLLHTYSYSSADPSPTLGIDHMSRSPLDPTHINIWFYLDGDDAYGRFAQLELATGTLSNVSDVLLASAQKVLAVPPYIGAPFTVVPAMFAPSTSCGFGTLLGDEVVVPVDEENNEEPVPGGTSTNSSCCDSHATPLGGETPTVPNPVGPLPPWETSCIGGGQVDSVADLGPVEVW